MSIKGTISRYFQWRQMNEWMDGEAPPGLPLNKSS